MMMEGNVADCLDEKGFSLDEIVLVGQKPYESMEGLTAGLKEGAVLVPDAQMRRGFLGIQFLPFEVFKKIDPRIEGRYFVFNRGGN